MAIKLLIRDYFVLIITVFLWNICQEFTQLYQNNEASLSIFEGQLTMARMKSNEVIDDRYIYSHHKFGVYDNFWLSDTIGESLSSFANDPAKKKKKNSDRIRRIFALLTIQSVWNCDSNRRFIMTGRTKWKLVCSMEASPSLWFLSCSRICLVNIWPLLIERRVSVFELY